MGDLIMSARERRRLEMMSRVRDEQVRLVKAAYLLNLSYRQAKRLWRRYRQEGDAGLVHRLRGRPSGRSKGKEFKQKVLDLYKTRYWDFGPTLACEYLVKDGYRLDHETLRGWLICEGRWERRRKRVRHRQWRERKEHMGELVQMDGSIHDWFEGRGPKAALMVMIDDATNRTYARFVPSETTEGAMECFEHYVRLYRLPQALYVDLDSIYRAPNGQPTVAEQLDGQARPRTQFERAMSILGVKISLAYSPQAKGRVERRNGVFQDRLVKALRLAGIKTIAEANQFLDRTFLSDMNRRFTVAPAAAIDLHRPIAKDINLTEVLSMEEPRTVARDWTIRWHNRYFQIKAEQSPLPLPGRVITLRQLRNGHVQLLYQGRKLQWNELPQRPIPVSPRRSLGPQVSRKSQIKIRLPRKPAANHPWRQYRMPYRPYSPLPSDELLMPILGERGSGLDHYPSQTHVPQQKGTFLNSLNRGHS